MKNKNKIIKGIDKTINENKSLNAKMKRLQRIRDLILNAIDNFYKNRIDKVLRKIEVNELQMSHGKEYSKRKLGGNKDE